MASSRDLELLIGPDAGDILRAALRPTGAEVESWRAQQVDHQPEHRSTVAYRVRVRWPGGRSTEERFAASTGPVRGDALVVGDGVDRVAVWRFPHDPDLPGLATAYDSGAVARLLADSGLGSGRVRLTLRAYRPRRRAVIEAVGACGRLFLKVVRPGRAESLHRRHRLLTGAGVPAPPSLGFTPDGVLVLQALPGRPMRQVLWTSGAAVPSGEEILALLDRLPAALLDAPRRRSWLDRSEHYAAVVGAALPAEADRAHQLAAAIVARAGTGPTVPVHGDFYENQVHVQAGRISGLLDVDTAGPGDRLDDLACLLAHLSVLALIEPRRAAAVNRLGARYLAGFERVVDRAALRYRVAAVALSLATGPHRVQEPGWEAGTRHRLDLVEQWLDSAPTRAGG